MKRSGPVRQKSGSSAIHDVLKEQIVVTYLAKTRFLHVANGHGRCDSFKPPAFQGRCPSGGSTRRRTRSGGTDGRGTAGRPFAPSHRASPNYLCGVGCELSVSRSSDDMREWRATIERHDSYEELILWFEHDLFDQLGLIQLLTLIRERLPMTKPVSLVCIEWFPGRAEFKGLGELTPDEIAPPLETRQRVGEPQTRWQNTSGRGSARRHPGLCDDVRQGETSALPYLAAALTRFIQEGPWTVDGLSRTERRLLELASGDGIASIGSIPAHA